MLDNQLEVAIPAQTELFQQFVSDTAIQNRVSVSIMEIDASAFDTVTAEFQFEDSGSGDIKDRILVEDCGVEITDYQVEKIQYDSARMLLCCDVSGSMSGKPIEDLREAVKRLASSNLDGAGIAIIAFDSSSRQILDFTSDKTAVAQAAESLNASGGTNVFQAVMNSLDSFGTRQDNSMDYIVVLSDGQSSDGETLEEVLRQIQEKAAEKGVLIHSLGLGDGVDANYLEALARTVGGTYSYVSNSETLDSFYQALQVRKDCSYRITYQAKDTLAQSRMLKISAKGEEYRYDEKEYWLPGAENPEGSHELVFTEDKLIKGLDTRFLFRSNQDVQIRLLGSGFAESDELTVEMKGDRSYDIKAEYVDETSYRLTIPAQTACGTYDIYVRLNGKQAILAKELVIAMTENQRMVEFGPYKFTAYQRVQMENLIALDGYVTLNSWLHFKGEVILRGDPSGETILLSDADGSYIQYRDSASMGLAQLLLKNNEVMEVPALGTLKLYRDDFHDADSADYRVDYQALPYLYPGGLIKLSTPGYALYPYQLKLDFQQFTTELPGQNVVFKTVMKDMFLFDVEKSEAILTGDNIGIKLEVSANAGEKVYYPCQFGSWNLNINPSGKVKVNTLDNEYGFELELKMMFFSWDGITLKANWKGLEQILPQDFEIGCSKSFTKVISGVPVTIGDFFLGAEKMKLDDIASTIWKGGLTVSVVNVSEICPVVEKYVGEDIALAALERITLSGRWSEWFLRLEATLKLLKYLDCGQVLFEIGNLSYTNELLGMKDVDVDGLRVRAEIGPKWDAKNIRLILRLASEIAMMDRVFGAGGDGTLDVMIRWWLPAIHFNAQGNIFMGVYTDHDGESFFTIRGRGGVGSGSDGAFDLSKPLNK